MTRTVAAQTVVVGAGPVGSLLALLLARRGHQVTVYESRPDPRRLPAPPGRSINLTLAERGWHALRAVDADAAVHEICVPLYGRMIHSPYGACAFQPYTSRHDAIYSASRAQLTDLLLEMVRAHPGVRVHFDHRCLEPDFDRRRLSFVGPGGVTTAVTARQVFAADGAWSTLRRGLLRAHAGSFFQRLSPMLYRELRLPPSGLTGDLAHREALHLWPRGQCMLVGFPNVDGSATVSMFMPLTGEESFAALTTPHELTRFLRDECPDLLAASPDLVQDFFARPPSLLVSSSCRPWVHEDWLALVGDAAHALVPFLGQGLNAGFEDCTVLLDCLSEHGDDGHAALRRYEQDRTENCETVIQLAEQHYEELAVRARDPLFRIRKWLEDRAYRLGPDRFVPLYTMVAFSRRPYTEVRCRQARQEEMLDRLMKHPAIRAREVGAHVDALIRDELAQLAV
ncbi:FAD-dependent oxidoreductase [Couchioplanes azureus]|uniref:FAD-dependent oxidoreductase n=1 Tax=Couchioplanes caeruleus TaxID=56438 RepID=UPI0016706CA0|nr:NAD(P)/FAD-dependent oxidoreductase [Couchioplanes caeruleus]GGQ75466.1 kynurenine 3-monooxygenase [Couchioplanes caeruleus subsp. azureus]